MKWSINSWIEPGMQKQNGVYCTVFSKQPIRNGNQAAYQYGVVWSDQNDQQDLAQKRVRREFFASARSSQRIFSQIVKVNVEIIHLKFSVLVIVIILIPPIQPPTSIKNNIFG